MIHTTDGSLFNTRYTHLAQNTIDYWMTPDDTELTEEALKRAVTEAPVLEDATVQIYVHVPFCAQHCRFCAFSGGNSLDFKAAERYARLVCDDLRSLLARTQARGLPIRAVNIGGGAPDLLGDHIRYVLQTVRDLPGVTDLTEVSVELTLSTTKKPFLDALAEFGVTKASFGVQTLDTSIRKLLRLPSTLSSMDHVLRDLADRVPVVNADLITGLPGQRLSGALHDLRALMNHPGVNAVSSYLLTPGAAPSLVAGLANGELPVQASPPEQAAMRLNTYTTLLRHGWVRKGTNTYIDPSRVRAETMDIIAGNECIGTSHYEAFLLAAGPQAVSFLPGVRVENTVDVRRWSDQVERGELPVHLSKCSTAHQRDTALWVFPLRYEGLPRERYERMVSANAVSADQRAEFSAAIDEGLVLSTETGFELSILGEVFMGHLVRRFKSPSGRRAVDDYIAEGYALGRSIAEGGIADTNAANNRQHAIELLQLGLTR